MSTRIRCLIAVPRSGNVPEVTSGQEVTLPDRVADAWIAAGRAEIVDRYADEEPESPADEGDTPATPARPARSVPRAPRRPGTGKRVTKRVTTRGTRRVKA